MKKLAFSVKLLCTRNAFGFVATTVETSRVQCSRHWCWGQEALEPKAAHENTPIQSTGQRTRNMRFSQHFGEREAHNSFRQSAALGCFPTHPTPQHISRNDIISHKVSLKSFCRDQYLHRSVNESANLSKYSLILT